jgi:branched-chain amino acid transport system ATP-binding protein
VLDVDGVIAGYGLVEAVHGIDLRVDAGEMVAIVGANGAGKTTFLRAISGLLPLWSGTITLGGRAVTNLAAHELAQAGIGHVPEGRKLFKPLDVESNLELGSYSRADNSQQSRSEDLEKIYQLFPRLRERRRQIAGTLSGGEQQMVAIGRALMGRPRLLLLDEPSLGLAPQIFLEIFDIIDQVRAGGVSILVVEQNVRLALEHAQRAYVFQTGRVVLSGPSADILDSDMIKDAYLGGVPAEV